MNKLQRKLKLVFSRRKVFFFVIFVPFSSSINLPTKKSFSQRSAGRNFADFSLRIFAEVILTRVGQETSWGRATHGDNYRSNQNCCLSTSRFSGGQKEGKKQDSLPYDLRSFWIPFSFFPYERQQFRFVFEMPQLDLIELTCITRASTNSGLNKKKIIIINVTGTVFKMYKTLILCVMYSTIRVIEVAAS